MPDDPSVKHKHYTKYVEQWTKVRDCIEGEEAVKAKGSEYLPHLEGDDADEYQAYKKRAEFFGATGRTVAALVGAIQRKAPDLDFPEDKKDLLERITDCQDSLEELIAQTLEQVSGVGRYGLLVDSSEHENGEPFVASYIAENITNWKEDTIGGRRVPVRVHLREEFEDVDPKNQFGVKWRERYRVLRLGRPNDEVAAEQKLTSDKVVYWQEIWQKQTDENKRETWQLMKTIVPRMRGGRVLNEIPIELINATGTGLRPSKPPVLDLANVNLSHYRNSADYEHGLHYTALPTPYATGWSLKKGELGGSPGKLALGSKTAWVTENHEARAGMLEFTGAGLSEVSKAMEDKVKRMAVLGARLLEEQKRAAEAAETQRLRQSGEQSALARISMACSDGLTSTLRRVVRWLGVQNEDDTTIELNKDFNLLGIDAQTLTALMAAVQANLLSYNSWFFNLKRGEIIPDNVTEEDEIERIMAGTPVQEPVRNEGEEGEAGEQQ